MWHNSVIEDTFDCSIGGNVMDPIQRYELIRPILQREKTVKQVHQETNVPMETHGEAVRLRLCAPAPSTDIFYVFGKGTENWKVLLISPMQLTPIRTGVPKNTKIRWSSTNFNIPTKAHAKLLLI